jgi:hypothetical protein
LHTDGATLAGADFRLNNVPIGGLNVVGDTQTITLPAGVLLSGTLADGTPFAFCCNDELNGGITLQLAAIPDTGLPIITVPGMPAPLGVRQGQTVVVEARGILGTNFNAGRGGILEVRQGGSVGDDLEAFGATININGGAVGKSARAYYGSTINIFSGALGDDLFASDSEINIRGGAIGSSFHADGSIVKISGGSFGSGFSAEGGSEINISGGSIGSGFGAVGGSVVNISGGFVGNALQAGNESLVNISGGVISNGLRVRNGGVVNISGGVFGSAYQDFIASGNVNLFGREFYLDGQRIEGMMLGEPFVLSQRQGTLSGVFRNGSRFAFVLTSGSGRDFRGFTQSAVLTLTLVPEPSSVSLLVVSALALASGTRRQRPFPRVLRSHFS